MALILAERIAGEGEPTDRQVLQSLAVAAVPVALIVAQPDLGTVLIISACVITMIAPEKINYLRTHPLLPPLSS